MPRATLKEATELQRIPNHRIPDSDRTPHRDEAADWLEREVVNGGREWSETTIRELSDASGWSREHISRVLDAYFEPAGGEPSDPLAQLVSQQLDVDGESPEYRAGFEDGFGAGVRFALSNPDLFVVEDGDLPDLTQ